MTGTVGTSLIATLVAIGVDVKQIGKVAVSHILGHEVASRDQRKALNTNFRRGYTRTRIDRPSANGAILADVLATQFPDAVVAAGGVVPLLIAISALGDFVVQPEKDRFQRDTHAVALTAKAFSDELRTLNIEEMRATGVMTEAPSAAPVAQAAPAAAAPAVTPVDVTTGL